MNVAEKVIVNETSLVVQGIDRLENKATIQAINQINARSTTARSFMDQSRTKIVDYYTTRLPAMLAKAKSLADRREYDQVLALLSAIPETIDQYPTVAAQISALNTQKINDKAVSVLFAAFVCTIANGATQDKELKKELKAKVEKSCRKEAKKLYKGGWAVMPGKLPLNRQLQDSRMTELTKDGKGNPFYFTAPHIATGGNYTAAKKIADSRAMTEIAEKVNSRINELIKENIANTNFGEGDIEVIDEFISSNKHTVSARLSGIVSTLEIFRQKESLTEVQVHIALNADEAIKMVTKACQSALQKESKKLAEELDELIKE